MDTCEVQNMRKSILSHTFNLIVCDEEKILSSISVVVSRQAKKENSSLYQSNLNLAAFSHRVP